MYEKDKRTRITVRLSEDQFQSIKVKADLLGISPSEFIRMLINSMMYFEKTQSPIDLNKLGGSSRENDKAHIDDKL